MVLRMPSRAWALAGDPNWILWMNVLDKVLGLHRDLLLIWGLDPRGWNLNLALPYQNREYICFDGGLQEHHNQSPEERI